MTISLASSLIEPMNEISDLYKKTYGKSLELNFGGPGALKEEMLNGVDVEIFISASKDDMRTNRKRFYFRRK